MNDLYSLDIGYEPAVWRGYWNPLPTVPNKLSMKSRFSAARAKQFRLERGLTQEKLGKLTGWDITVISRLESGRVRDPRVSTVWKLACALDRKVEDFFEVER